jgi:fatty acid desaturase
MKHFEERLGLHLTVLAAVILAVVAALVLGGAGVAVIVVIGALVILAIGFPLLVILSEEHNLPTARRRDGRAPR